ncbi:MAG: DMT family transporter [Acidimicrobiia bacterium]|nr:DMT family transporter [Acidimicrobiia bacterium]
MSRRSIAILALTFLAVAWGAIPLIVREDVPWQGLVTTRVWLGAATLFLLMAATGRLKMPATHRPQIIAAGVLLAVHWATFFWAIKLTSVAVALAVVFLGPVTAAVLAPRFLNEKVPGRVYWALAVAFTGVVLVVAFEGGGAEQETWQGVAIAVVSALTVAGLLLVSKAAVDAVGPLVVTAGELATASVVLSPFLGTAVRGTLDNPLPLLTLGILITGFGYLIFWTATRELPVAVVSVLMHVEPASAVVLALIFLGETPAPWQWIGIALVIAGGLLAAGDAAEEEVLSAPANL